jgi:hypothetical protein
MRRRLRSDASVEQQLLHSAGVVPRPARVGGRVGSRAARARRQALPHARACRLRSPRAGTDIAPSATPATNATSGTAHCCLLHSARLPLVADTEARRGRRCCARPRAGRQRRRAPARTPPWPRCRSAAPRSRRCWPRARERPPPTAGRRTGPRPPPRHSPASARAGRPPRAAARARRRRPRRRGRPRARARPLAAGEAGAWGTLLRRRRRRRRRRRESSCPPCWSCCTGRRTRLIWLRCWARCARCCANPSRARAPWRPRLRPAAAPPAPPRPRRTLTTIPEPSRAAPCARRSRPRTLLPPGPPWPAQEQAPSRAPWPPRHCFAGAAEHGGVLPLSGGQATMLRYCA